MKRWIIISLVIIALAFVAIYIFIPDVIHIKRTDTINITADGLNRIVFNNKKWNKWWPGKTPVNTAANTGFYNEYKNNIYEVIGNDYGILSVIIKNRLFFSNTNILAIPKRADSLQLIWTGDIPTSYNPAKRIQIYLASKKLEADMDMILKRLRTNFNSPDEIYGIKLQYENVKDSFLISTFKLANFYPSSADIYELVGKLKNYAKNYSAEETGYPMLHVIRQDSSKWLTKVAIPINKIVETSGEISFKRMLGGGKILMTEIQGGPGKIKNALAQMDNFVLDYHYTMPAISFQSLVTSRIAETDTTKWVTRIYYPVQ